MPKKALDALADLLELESEGAGAALSACGLAALDLALIEDFTKIQRRLEDVDEQMASVLGNAVARERFLVHGVHGLETEYLEKFADVVDAVLDGYDEVFAFNEFSKVPGKKLRFFVHLEEKIEAPPHFAPEFPYHSQVDFPVINAEEFESPTPAGQFLFYGLCHELGHVVAMWDRPNAPEDHHTWAHYTGVTIVEHLSEGKRSKALKYCRDVQWRSLEKERKQAEEIEPSTKKEGAMAMWVTLHDLVGPKAIGAAINQLDEDDKRMRSNHVRYYTWRELKKALLAQVKKKKKAKKRLEKLLP